MTHKHTHIHIVLNRNIVTGQKALDKVRIRVWVTKHKRIWDHNLSKVNYCKKVPRLKIFQSDPCYPGLIKLDQLRDMSEFWISKQTKGEIIFDKE